MMALEHSIVDPGKGMGKGRGMETGRLRRKKR